MAERVHYHPNLIFSAGTQVVTLVDIPGSAGLVLHPRGTVGVVVKAPADHDHSYRVRFLDGFESTLKPSEVSMLARFVWDTESGKELRRIPLHDPRRGEKKQPVWKLHVTPDGQTVYVLAYCPDDEQFDIRRITGIVTSWQLGTGKRNTFVPDVPSDAFGSAFSPDGHALASKGALFDTATGKQLVKLSADFGTQGSETDAGSVSGVGTNAFSSTGRLIAGLIKRRKTAGGRQSVITAAIQIWEAASGRVIGRFAMDQLGNPRLAFSPDDHYLAANDADSVLLYDLISGQVVQRLMGGRPPENPPGENPFATCLSFAPDGRSLVTGHADSTATIWALSPRPAREPSVTPAIREELRRLWDILAGQDAARAYRESWRLIDAPGITLPFLGEHLRPIAYPPGDETRRLLADLDDSDFKKREAAEAALRKLGDGVESALKEVLVGQPSLEKRRRVEQLLKALAEPPMGTALRDLRALAVLERIGTPQARRLLESLSRGLPTAGLTRDAKASVERLGKRASLTP